ncbi:hypothetical protein ACT17S_00415 [Glutamicibacter mysorens]
MSTTEAKNNLQAQLDAQALAERVTVDRKDLERLLQCIDDVHEWARNFPWPSGDAV